ncbi:hypothetical protein [Opitutus sp. ER46]|uniref:hypothetical protein n=1 Tax=Opitutus sp. ER46 TaxID=2161864 RepID=UPI000D3254B6|nr:hypothetical protein [Opitutus sp. ER46]PTX90755.1 hypothetical protein DB354_19030 [Opitutus sp. ER46]
MNPETLDALLIDRALGELDPEHAALLDAYLALAPAASARAAQLEGTMNLTRRLLAPAIRSAGADPTTAVPSRPEVRPGVWRRYRGEWLRLAACLLLGGAIGWSVTALRERDSNTSHTPVPVARAPATPTRPATDSFWSPAAAARTHRDTGGQRLVPLHRLRWDSPLRKPTLEEIP